MPKVSFVMPTHNRIEWLGEALSSLLDQKEKDIEIIIVNDASTDGTKEFIDEWAVQDSRVKVIHNETPKGAGASRTFGIHAAKSDIVIQMDDDDEAADDLAESAVRWFQENPKSELVNFPYVRIGYFGEVLEAFYGSQFDHDAFQKDGTVSYFCNPGSAMRKSAAIEIGYPSESDGLTDDVQMLRKWVASGKRVDFDNRIAGVKHRVLQASMMAKQRGWKPEWVTA